MTDGLAHEFQLNLAERQIQRATNTDELRDLALRLLRALEAQHETFNQMVKAGWLNRPPH